MILELIYLTFVAAGALAVGNVARQRFHSTESKLEGFLASSGIGFIVIAAVMLILGILKLYTAPIFAVANAILLLLIIFQARKIAATAIPDLRWLKDSALTIKLVFAIFIFFTVLNLVASAAPPASADALLHHLTAPKEYLASHGIVPLPSLQLMTEAPMSVNMLYLHGLQLLNGKLSQMIAWYLSFLAALSVFLIASRMSSKQTAVVAATVFATLPIFSVFNTRPYVDIPLAFFALLSIYFFIEWVEKAEMKAAVLTGLFIGMAVSSKNIGVLTGAALAISAAIMFFTVPGSSRGKFAAQAVAVLVIAAAMLAPWLIKSYINTGDPLYPLLYKYFGGTYWNSGLSSILLEFHRSQGIGFSLQSLILFPFEVTTNPVLFADTAGITPLFLGTLPLLWVLRKKIPKQAATLLILAAVLVGLQFFIAQQTRYMFVALGILSVITAYIVCSFRTERLVQAGLYSFLFLSLSINAVLWAAANLDDLPVTVGLQPERDYLTKKVPTYAATEFLASTDKNAVVCWYGTGRGFWAKNPYVWCNPLYQGYVNFFEMETVADVAARMNELNISYVLYERNMQEPPLYGKKKVFSDQTTGYYFRSNQLMQSYLADYSQKTYDDKNAEIYRINKESQSVIIT